MNREEHIESNILTLINQWINLATGAGSLVILSLVILDYLVTPVNFKTFVVYRVIAAIGILSVHFFNKNKIDKRRQNTATIVGAAIVATMVALMIEKYGGHESPYFVGIILTIFFVVGLTSLNVKMSIITSIIVYAIYLFPILVYDTITNIPLFINANIFIIATIFATVILRYLIQQRFVSEFGLQYDLEQEKRTT